jgi:glycine C-acetyltransferase
VSGARTTCGTQDLHQELEARLSRFLGTEDTILYGSAYSANGGLFEALLGPEDAVIGDELNHASIVDGIRLCSARHLRYRHDDMQDLRAQLRAAQEGGARHKLVFTDGVFSMDGTLARLGEMRALCDEFGALLGFDDSHATGFVGKSGRGTHEQRDVFGKVDIITGTLGKALGGGCGGFTSGKRQVVQVLRQRSRPYLFSNSLAPAIVGATLKALDLMEADTSLRDRLEENTRHFRAGLIARDFVLKPGEHPIIPVMLHDAGLTQRFARRLLELGVFVTGFVHPVVPEGQARIRGAFAQVRREMAL